MYTHTFYHTIHFHRCVDGYINVVLEVLLLMYGGVDTSAVIKTVESITIGLLMKQYLEGMCVCVCVHVIEV